MHCNGDGGGEVGLVDGCRSAGASRVAECKSLIYTFLHVSRTCMYTYTFYAHFIHV